MSVHATTPLIPNTLLYATAAELTIPADGTWQDVGSWDTLHLYVSSLNGAGRLRILWSDDPNMAGQHFDSEAYDLGYASGQGTGGTLIGGAQNIVVPTEKPWVRFALDSSLGVQPAVLAWQFQAEVSNLGRRRSSLAVMSDDPEGIDLTTARPYLAQLVAKSVAGGASYTLYVVPYFGRARLWANPPPGVTVALQTVSPTGADPIVFERIDGTIGTGTLGPLQSGRAVVAGAGSGVIVAPPGAGKQLYVASALIECYSSGNSIGHIQSDSGTIIAEGPAVLGFVATPNLGGGLGLGDNTGVKLVVDSGTTGNFSGIVNYQTGPTTAGEGGSQGRDVILPPGVVALVVTNNTGAAQSVSAALVPEWS
jgi:hypothetical protein